MSALRSGLSPMVRVLMGPFRWYHHQLLARPLLVKSLTSGLMLSTADFLSQRIRRPPHPDEPSPPSSSLGEADHQGWWNMQQTTWMGVYGALFVSPFCHVWYQVLERMIPLKGAVSITSRLRKVSQRVVLDQMVMAPTFASGLFLSRGLIAGENLSTIWQTMKKDWVRVMIAGAMVWPPAQMINFLVVPLPYRILFINLVGLGWSTYTSFVASRGYQRLHLPPIVAPMHDMPSSPMTADCLTNLFFIETRTEPLPPLPYLPPSLVRSKKEGKKKDTTPTSRTSLRSG